MKPFAPLGLLFAVTLFAAPAVAQDIDNADANHDGKITRAEFSAARLANFGKFDRNGDGVISPSDFERLARFKPQAGQALQQMIANADKNRDGHVTRTELAEAPIPAFDRADANHDGVIDETERAALRSTLAQMRGR